MIDLLAGLVPAAAFGASPTNPRLMLRKPRPTGRPLIDRRVFRLGYTWFAAYGLIPALLGFGAAVLLTNTSFQEPLAQQFVGLLAADSTPRTLFADLLTTAYVFVGLAGLLGGGLVLRSGKHLARKQRAITYGVAVTALVAALYVLSQTAFQPFLHFTLLPWWGWATAFAMLVAAVFIERLRQAMDRTPER